MRLSTFVWHLHNACIDVKQGFSVLIFGSYQGKVQAMYDDLTAKSKAGTLDVGLITAKDIMPATIDASKLAVTTIDYPNLTGMSVTAPAPTGIKDWNVSGPVGDTVKFDPSQFKDIGFEFGGYGYVDPPVKKIKVKTKKTAKKIAKKIKADKKKAKKKKS